MTPIRLTDCLEVAATDGFAGCLAAALKTLPAGSLPLQDGCSQGGLADDSDISASVLSVAQTEDRVVARVGVFFSEVVGGCNCDADPLASNAYCVLEVVLDRGNGVAEFSVLEE